MGDTAASASSLGITTAAPRLVGSAGVAGMVQLHQALPLIERQHALIEELRSRAPRFSTGSALAQRTGTSRRTVERDIALLAAAGVPVEVRRGPGGGYRLPARDRELHLTLTPGEVAALIASLVAVGPYTSATAQSVLAKLLALYR
ncbi:HTH domain-containing protein [Actinotalea ferrariae]|uniref:helix-turn-helix transcriptional regulator n=1 Tax=Actinotalea ferrariae TaxID=1386098 RepID=UPI001EB7CA63|nr:HTH domain-containing protein [Actinotalea ferrariae]MBX9246818.1 HTH domain-containing protein [Actinotalea ferrariae]